MTGSNAIPINDLLEVTPEEFMLQSLEIIDSLPDANQKRRPWSVFSDYFWDLRERLDNKKMRESNGWDVDDLSFLPTLAARNIWMVLEQWRKVSAKNMGLTPEFMELASKIECAVRRFDNATRYGRMLKQDDWDFVYAEMQEAMALFPLVLFKLIGINDEDYEDYEDYEDDDEFERII